jgi:hypothetical protein
MKKSFLKKLPSWLKAVFSLVLGLWIVLNIIYLAGAEGVRSVKTGARISFDRKFDFQLFGIDEKHAFAVHDNKYISIVKYKKAPLPFCFICGYFDSDGTVVNGIDYFKDGWFYSNYAGLGPFPDAFQVSTKKTLKIEKESTPEDDLPLLYQKNNLLRDSAYVFDIKKLKANYPPLSTLKESCMVFNAAFILIFVILLSISVGYIFKPKD